MKSLVPKQWRRLKDEQVRTVASRFAALAPNLDDPRYRPASNTLARLSLVMERSYDFLKTRGDLADQSGIELCTSIDTFRRLCDSQLAMLAAMGLTPTAELPTAVSSAELDAVYHRVANRKVIRNKSNGSDGTPTA